MTTCCSYLKSPLHMVLAFHLEKIYGIRIFGGEDVG
jgi:hypothetical protein